MNTPVSVTTPAASTASTDAPRERLCPSTELLNGGKAHVFDLLEYGQPARGFVLRFDDKVHGYLNRCAHVPAEMDWQEGQFFDDTGRWILCSIHGAAYEPNTGYCVGGPCRGKQLKALHIEEQDGQVYWYPSQTLTPVFSDPA